MNTTFDVGNYTSHVKCDGPCNILAKPKEMDYKVVNLGVDKDIITTHNSLDEAEKETGHKWNYNQLMLEQHIRDDQEYVQLDEGREPLLSAGG